MKIIEQFGVPTIYVDDFCNHQVINGNVHALGYREQHEPGTDPVGIVEVRIIMSIKSFFAACARGMEMGRTGEAAPEKVSSQHH